MRKIISVFLISIFLTMSCTHLIVANDRSFDETIPMALTGAFTGTLFGLNQYGQSQQTNPKQLALGAAYGLATGALLGAGIDMFEITSRQDVLAGKITQSIVLGGVSGAFFGSFIAFIPYALTSEPNIRITDDNFYHASIGAGLGGLIGGSIWLMITLLTEPLIIANDTSMKIKVGIQSEVNLLKLKQEKAALVSYRFLEINY